MNTSRLLLTEIHGPIITNYKYRREDNWVQKLREEEDTVLLQFGRPCKTFFTWKPFLSSLPSFKGHLFYFHSGCYSIEKYLNGCSNDSMAYRTKRIYFLFVQKKLQKIKMNRINLKRIKLLKKLIKATIIILLCTKIGTGTN